MNKLKLCRFTDEYLNKMHEYYRSIQNQYWIDKTEAMRGQIYIIMGEHDHAPGHFVLMNFDTKEMIVMVDDWALEILDKHPSDVTIFCTI